MDKCQIYRKFVMFKNKPNLGTMRKKSLNLSMYLGLVSSALAPRFVSPS